MSDQKSHLRVISAGIEKEESSSWTRYTGTKEKLIAAGVATEDMFPIWPKRVKDNYGPDTTLEDKYSTKYIKGGRYQLRRYHEYRELPKRPPAWNPATFRAELQRQAGAFLGMLIDESVGRFEQSAYGRCVHRLSEQDVTDLRQMREVFMNRIAKSRVVPGPGVLRCV